MKGNFAQAMRELTGFNNNDSESTKQSSQSSQHSQQQNASSAPFPNKEDFVASNVAKDEDEDVGFKISENSTQITKSMTINGDIKSLDDLIIDGQVFGDITTAKNVELSDLIVGDLKANNLNLNNARLKGDVTLNGDMNVEKNSIVVGNVACENLMVAGKIKGDLDIRDATAVLDTALISGNIVASSIATEPGAYIIGSVTTRNPALDFDLDAQFDFGGDF